MASNKPRFLTTVTILRVGDLSAEVAFYKSLGLDLVFEEDEPPYFVCLGNKEISFGLEVGDDVDVVSANNAVSWGFTTESLRPLIAFARREGLSIEGPICYWPENDRWKMWIPTPAGYRLGLEGPNPDNE